MLEPERLRRLWPFAVVAAAGQLSAAWPPGPSDMRYFLVSSALLAASLVLAVVVRRGPLGSNLLLATTYVGSVGFLMLANGGVGSGLGSLLYVPAVGLALYGSRWESAAVVVPIVVTLFAVSIDSSDPAAATARRVVLLAAVAVMLSVAIHALRERLLESNRHTTRLLLEAEAINMKLEEQATAEERRRIARELHDGLAHELAFIASRARRSARVGAETSDLRELANAADRALDEARRAITVLSTNDPQSLASAVAQAAEDLGARHGIPVSADIREDVDLPGDVLENMLRIVREAITNAALHGQPNRIGVQLVRIQDQLRLVIEDDGCGFDGQGRGPSSGFGLLSMEERAESVGAHLNIDSSPGNGTRVEVTLP